jgi:hypothetical protein
VRVERPAPVDDVVALVANGAAVLTTSMGRTCARPAVPRGSGSDDADVLDAVAAMTGVTGVLVRPLDEGTVLVDATGGNPRDGWQWTPLGSLPESRNPLREAPWLDRGWLASTVDRIDAALADLGRRRTGPAVQVRHWSMSSVLRVPTDAGDVYHKAVLPHLAHEPAVTTLLQAAGADVPSIIGSTADGWLSDDIGGTAVPWLPPAERLGALTALAACQVGMLDRIGDVRAAGCPTVSLDDLAARVPALIRRDDLWPGTDRAIRADLGLRLQDACADLDEYDLPSTLVHGDFHANNVARVDRRFTLFDWSFAAVSHPLLDLATWLAPDDDPRPALAAYSGPWRAIVNPATLRAAWAAAVPVAGLVELLKLVDLADRVGPAYAFEYLPAAIGWARRLSR